MRVHTYLASRHLVQDTDRRSSKAIPHIFEGLICILYSRQPSQRTTRTNHLDRASDRITCATDRPTSKVLANHSEQYPTEQPLSSPVHHHRRFEEPPKPRTTDLFQPVFEGYLSSKTKQHTPPGDEAARTTKSESTPLNNFASNRDKPNPQNSLTNERVNSIKWSLLHPPNQRKQAKYERLPKCITCVCL